MFFGAVGLQGQKVHGDAFKREREAAGKPNSWALGPMALRQGSSALSDMGSLLKICNRQRVLSNQSWQTSEPSIFKSKREGHRHTTLGHLVQTVVSEWRPLQVCSGGTAKSHVLPEQL